MKVLITGATGLLGGHLLRTLQQRGEQIRALVLPSENAEKLTAQGVEVLRGDVTDANTLAPAVEDIEIIIHLAGMMGVERPLADYRMVNVTGSGNLYQAAQKAGVRRFVHTSSHTVYGLGYGRFLTEKDALRPDPDPYSLSGCTLAWLSGYMQRAVSNSNGRYWLAGLSVVLLIFTLGMQQSQALYAGWADTSGLSYVLHTQMRDNSGRFLVEDIEVARYDARDITELWQWNGVLFFYYVNPAHQALLGDEALTQAIDNRYFALVELSFNYQPAEAHFIAQQMVASRNYDLIAKILFQNSFGRGHFFIFRSAAVAGHGNFKSLSQVKF